MKPLAALVMALGLSACAVSAPGGLVPAATLSDPESRLLARDSGGAWADPAPLSGLRAAGTAQCATTPKGSACLLQDEGTGTNRGLATAPKGRCLASWTVGAGTTVATVTLHRNAFPTPRGARYERLYYMLNSGGMLDVTSRLTDPAAFARLCDQLLQPDTLMKRRHR